MPHTSRVMKIDSTTNIVILVEKINDFASKYLSTAIPDAGLSDIQK